MVEMISYSIIQKSQLKDLHRIDADYYQPEYLKVEQTLKSIKTVSIHELSESVVNFGAYSLCNYIVWQESGIPYLNVENIKDGYIDFNGVKFIDDEVNEILKKSKVKEGQVIVTMAGTIGNVGVAHKAPSKINSNQATAKITLKKDFSPYVLAAFLNSYYGRKQTEREIVSSVQPNIFLWQIKNLKVPVLSKDKKREIEYVYIKGLDTYERSELLYSQAENLLLEELGLKDFEPEDELSYVVNLSDVKSAQRVDAAYFQPKYDTLRSKINNPKKLTDLVKNIPARFNPVEQPDKIFKYVELANIDSSIGIINGYSAVLGQDAPSRAKRMLKAGDVIVSSVEGSLEKVALVGKKQNGFLASTGFFQFRSKEILPEVLLVLSKSSVLQMQLEKQCAGTILTAVPKHSIEKNILMPTLPKLTQKKIADLIIQSHQARKMAKNLLEKAKREVERFVEKTRIKEK